MTISNNNILYNLVFLNLNEFVIIVNSTLLLSKALLFSQNQNLPKIILTLHHKIVVIFSK